MTFPEFLDCTQRDLVLFIEAKAEAEKDRRVHEWDMTRHIMWAVLQSQSTKEIKPKQILRLPGETVARDEMTPYEKQELKKWEEAQDREMIEMMKKNAV